MAVSPLERVRHQRRQPGRDQLHHRPGRAMAAIGSADAVLQQTMFSPARCRACCRGWSLPAGPIAVAFGGEYRQGSRPRHRRRQRLGGGLERGQLLGLHRPVQCDGRLRRSDRADPEGQHSSSRWNSTRRAASRPIPPRAWWRLGSWVSPARSMTISVCAHLVVRHPRPDLQELFATGFSVLATQPDIHNNNNPVSAYTLQGGNPALKPEKSTTISGGVVLDAALGGWPEPVGRLLLDQHQGRDRHHRHQCNLGAMPGRRAGCSATS